MKSLDVVTIGRALVDLYGIQIGSRLADIRSFAKSVGGCPANIAIGTSRLGLKSGLISKVGAEQMGQFILEQLEFEGVNVKGITIDQERLTAIVLLAAENEDSFPLIFFRENCADIALNVDDIDEDFIKSTKSIVVSGTHFSREHTALAQMKAIEIAKSTNCKVIFDIDFRPNLWGLASHSKGDLRYVQSKKVSESLQKILKDCDLIVGTEEEVKVASNEDDLIRALKKIRELSKAIIVLKLGPQGCAVFEDGEINSIDQGIRGESFKVDVCNVLGAGDSFLSGFLRGWLRDEDLKTCASWGNACGAIVVGRLLCSAEIPSFEEMQYFINRENKISNLSEDKKLKKLHSLTFRHRYNKNIKIFAIDHRPYFEELATNNNKDFSSIAKFKELALRAVSKIAKDDENSKTNTYGILMDDKNAGKVILKTFDKKLWLARPIELSAKRPLEFEQADLGSTLSKWAAHSIVKVLCNYHISDNQEMKDSQIASLKQAYNASQDSGHQFLIEIISQNLGEINENTIANIMIDFYKAGIAPDWWKLEAQNSAKAWQNIDAVINNYDDKIQGILVLGYDAPVEDVISSFEIANSSKWVRGFAIGRTVFSSTAKEWFAGSLNDELAVTNLANNFLRLCNAWDKIRQN